MNKTNTKRALLLSLVSLWLCFSMMLGTTFAWFTDSVNVANNRIVAGNLDVELLYKNGEMADFANATDTNAVMFVDKDGDDILWEPGAVAYTNFQVKNVGSLALKYAMNVVVTDETTTTVNGEVLSLEDVIKVAVLSGETVDSREAAIAKANASGIKFSEIATSGDLLPAGNVLNLEEYDECAVVLYWAPNADDIDNKYNLNNSRQNEADLDIVFDIRVVASQLTHEEDSFGDDYDEDAAIPVISTANVDGSSDVEVPAGAATVVVPAGAPAGEYQTKLAGVYSDTDDDGKTVTTYDLSMYYNGEAVTGTDNYPVMLAFEPFSAISAFSLGNEPVAYDYDPVSGELSFETSKFGLFTVESEDVAEGAETEDGKITAGVFKGVNPADYDASLKEDDSEYIAINYEQNGETYYVVSKRATTVLLAAPDTVYTADNGNYSAKTTSGNLYSEISALQNNEHSNVFMLPGSYNEGTTVYVYSSMDIVGLGDKEDIVVTKTSSSNSNRHLFNANGTKADYIEVTIRNMTLDATATTTGGKDNAAVQSIRKSKVKCYDLNIIKSTTDWSAVAFYVNGNNAVDGIKYPAYLYVENCLNTTRTFGIVSTVGSYKFYHNDLFYNSGSTEYTQNSGSIRNQTMDANDWEW